MANALIHEALITGSLEHPTIIPIHSVNLTGPNGPEVIMKRVQGKTILELLQKQSSYDLDEILNALIQVCNGLEYAHSHSIFHRDVKPENIMLGEFGEVYLLDWGIAVKRGEGSPTGW